MINMYIVIIFLLLFCLSAWKSSSFFLCGICQEYSVFAERLITNLLLKTLGKE